MTAICSNLFSAPAPIEYAAGGRMVLREYQHEDIGHVLGAWESGKIAVLCRHATGLGKSVAIAEIARVRSQTGRVLVTVDVGSLATDLAQTIHRHTGAEVGMLTGQIKEGVTTAPILVSTIQTLYAGDDGKEWYTSLDPADFNTVLVDECESSIAERYSQVLWHLRNGNDAIRFAGLTATPCRGDGRGMGEFYDYAMNEAGPLNRDILWGRDSGWLVNVKQAFVSVSLDFSTLKLRKDDDGVMDYSESDLSAMLENESSLRELALGIDHVAKGEPGIVICPNSVELAKALAGHLHAVRSGSAEVVYGDQGRRADDLLSAYKRGAFPYVVSVNKLYKGFDSDRVKFVFMCRKTRSRRLYEQAMGRGTRPLVSIRQALGLAANSEERRNIIATSPKPHMVMVDMVGVHDEAKDLGVIDILGDALPEPVRERAKKKLLEQKDEELPLEPEAAARDAQKDIAEEARIKEESEKRKRKMVQVDGHVSVEETSDLSTSGGSRSASPKTVPQRQIDLLKKAKLTDKEISGLKPDQISYLSREIVRRWKSKLCSYRQAKVLRRAGYSKSELHEMGYEAASAAITEVKANGWKRPMVNV